MSDRDRVLEAVDLAQRIAVVMHRLPDGDTTGSALGLTRVLRHLGKETWTVGPDPVAPFFRFLPGADQQRTWEQIDPQSMPFDLAITVDCGDAARAFGLDQLHQLASTLVNIDHHLTNQRFGDINWIDKDRCAVGEMVIDLADALDVPLDADTALCCYVAIATDTDGLRHGFDDARVLDLTSRLIRTGFSPEHVHHLLWERQSLPTLKLTGWALQHLQVLPSGKVAWVAIPRTVFQQFSASLYDSEGVVNHVRSLDGVKLALLFREEDTDMIKISLRSHLPWEASVVAAQIGGGGHRLSAGANLPGSLESVVRRTLKAVENLYGEDVPWTALSIY